MAQNKNMLITLALVIVIAIAFGVFAYTNMYNSDDGINDNSTDNGTNDSAGNGNNGSDTSDSEKIDDGIILTIMHQGTNYTYTLFDLESLPSYTGSGRYIKTRLLPDSVVLGTVYNYTGIPIKSLIERVNISSEKYKINIISSDDWITTYSMNETQGTVEIYNETGSIVESETTTMIVAFKENGKYYSEFDTENEIGPLRIAFVGEDTPITSSSLWAKMVTTIEIVYIA